MVILRIVVNVAGDVLLLDAADAMLESRRARKRKRTRERFWVASVRHERRGIVRKLDLNLRQRLDRRNRPRLRTAREITVRQIKDRRHVFERESHGFDRLTLTVTAPDSLEQIRLFSVCRQTG